MDTTVVSTSNTKPKFYGREVRRVRGHYFYLRRRLGKLKKFKAIWKIGRERRVMDNLLHKISREIVDRAEKGGVVIVSGDLKEVKIKKKTRGRSSTESYLHFHTTAFPDSSNTRRLEKALWWSR